MPDSSVTFRSGSRDYTLTADAVAAVAAQEPPRRVNSYFVVIGGRQYPPKQLVRSAADVSGFFDTGLAVRVLGQLGYEVQRVDQ